MSQDNTVGLINQVHSLSSQRTVCIEIRCHGLFTNFINHPYLSLILPTAMVSVPTGTFCFNLSRGDGPSVLLRVTEASFATRHDEFLPQSFLLPSCQWNGPRPASHGMPSPASSSWDRRGDRRLSVQPQLFPCDTLKNSS